MIDESLKKKRQTFLFILTTTGVIFISVGLYFIWQPLAFIFWGVILLALAYGFVKEWKISEGDD